MKILIVCLGNICRSPLAEGILRNKIESNNLNWIVDSAGTSGYHDGEPPHHLSIKIAKQKGIDISKQVSRKFIREDIEIFDRIYVMDKSNYAEVKRICGNGFVTNKVDLLLNLIEPYKNNEVPDPWYDGEESYHKVFQMIDEACEKLISSLN